MDMKIKRVKLYTTEEGVVRYRVTIDEVIPGIVVVNNQYVDGQVMHVDFVPRYFMAICLEQVEGLAYRYEKQNERATFDPENNSKFGAAELDIFLRDAEIEIRRTEFNVGDEYVDKDGVIHTRKHHGYNTEILDIKVTDKIQKKLDAMLEKAFSI